MDWSDYFNTYMKMPGIIRQAALIYESSVIANESTDTFLDKRAIRRLWQKKKPKDSVIIGGAKYLYIRDIVDEQDGYSISLYQKVKDDSDDPEEANVMFVSCMDNLLWVGTFNNNQKTQVISFMEPISSHIFAHIVQNEE
ncbi:hypothetical protein NEPAR06_0767 [Nematocida parisii]|uniref:Uncharacterized protein n=1 Tax=Nematocida parisii (strain ERTm3) TaxID=935791 RepID=I3EJ71_NEMP3|nr:uncharacterized protein NEPG_02506 [Nematocida parisii ERTm1]EIJ89268.1 hypothetical protein NEQG_00038 [Nematocida parisii ERTm3]KAI5125637.1 hypothetical protein NEPAR03_0165 [Nematocida parisii]EIJ92618.1 hypothetical protein NEPG_02506 [Nematocida parisii ERTm1]KAI5125741.1 hypothetical protein NEPAR08_0179 [Nematocida parisii]KAI5140226.1 hypothetical protein NEPAR04_0171 [Nematocida parisii]|eukprot:XP_013060333.1 hypothetical protein NEPG_02506 [Nematocida parisii ERTm1]